MKTNIQSGQTSLKLPSKARRSENPLAISRGKRQAKRRFFGPRNRSQKCTPYPEVPLSLMRQRKDARHLIVQRNASPSHDLIAP
jgi:hypothetical protein